MIRLRAIVIAALGFLWAAVAFAAPNFPAFTAPVVDQAGLLTQDQQVMLSNKLATYQQQSGHQMAIAIVKSLEGYDIRDYGYQLGRAWGVGKKGKDDGVLILVAPTEHKVSIEVGYGFEGDLTDAVSAIIISHDIAPKFRNGDFIGGLWNATDDIIKVLGGQGGAIVQAAQNQAQPSRGSTLAAAIPIIIFMLIVIIILANASHGGVVFLPMGGMGGGYRGVAVTVLAAVEAVALAAGGGGSFGGGGASGGLVMRIFGPDLTPGERAKVTHAVREAEKKTSGEIVAVVAHASDDYLHVPLHIATGLALLVPLVVWAWSELHPWDEDVEYWALFLIQLGVFVVVVLILDLPPLRRLVTPKRLKRKYAHRNAAAQFLATNIPTTVDRTGVLLFVSLFERHVEVIGDEAIAAKVKPGDWQAIIDGMLPLLKTGQTCEAMVQGVGRSGALLARHFPRRGRRPQQLADRVIVLR